MSSVNHIVNFDMSILTEQKDDPRYANSIFRDLKNFGPKLKGSIYEKIVRSIFTKLGYKVEKSKNTDHDLILNGKKVELKGSMLNKGTDLFSFLQIRPTQDYDDIVFSFLYPDKILLVRMSKADVQKAIDLGIFRPQHGGKKGHSNTFCYYGTETKLIEFGGVFV